jgi:RNA polymerase sigma factor (sigma-70 family)
LRAVEANYSGNLRRAPRRELSPSVSQVMPDSAKAPGEPTLNAWLAELRKHGELVQGLCESAGLGTFGFSVRDFLPHLARSVSSRFRGSPASEAELESYLNTLHLQDFVLACACLEGTEPAWDLFVRTYRGYLRACAAMMLQRGSDAPEAVELADSLFAELYGLADGRPGTGSLLRYFHGRSSLKTWLRAVLAQRHVDTIRAARRFASLDDGDAATRLGDLDGAAAAPQRKAANLTGPLALPADPYREKYIGMFCEALQNALGKLEPTDRRRVCLYYAEGKTLAEVGRLCSEHESSVSRNLERVRRQLRVEVEGSLRRGSAEKLSDDAGGSRWSGLSDAQIALCFQYATEDAPIDFNLLFPGDGAETRPGGEASSGTTAGRTSRRKEP